MYITCMQINFLFPHHHCQLEQYFSVRRLLWLWLLNVPVPAISFSLFNFLPPTPLQNLRHLCDGLFKVIKVVRGKVKWVISMFLFWCIHVLLPGRPVSHSDLKFMARVHTYSSSETEGAWWNTLELETNVIVSFFFFSFFFMALRLKVL